MSLDRNPERPVAAQVEHSHNAYVLKQQNQAGTAEGSDAQFWFELVDEKVAAEFLDLTNRTMQSLRQTSAGPPFVRLSARAIKYRRIDLKTWTESLLRKSTSDPGPADIP